MGPARIHNNLEDAVRSQGGSIRFFDDSTIIKKNLESGCPSDLVKAVIFFGGSAAIAKQLLPALKDALTAWINLRADREIEIHAQGVQVRIKGRNDVEEAIAVLGRIAEQEARQTDQTGQQPDKNG